MIYTGIDPGTEKSGLVVMDGDTLTYSADLQNFYARQQLGHGTQVICEWLNCMGMPVGQSSFHTCRWIGRFQEYHESRSTRDTFHLIERDAVKLALCNSIRGVTDAVIRRRLLDLFPQTGGGKTPAIGTKAQPGPLYGLSGHATQALAAVVAWRMNNNQWERGQL